ncbi:MAG: EAL domain-containing protein [Proteobacteria bacterium]|nr:EAL domain-containing protein [Pseudomonadota bacterium]
MSDAVSHLARLEAALGAAGDVAYDWDMAAGMISWLAGPEQSLILLGGGGASSAQRLHDRIHPEDLRSRLDAVASLHHQNASFECEFRLRDANGNHHWYHDRGAAQFDANGKISRICGALRPISQEKSDRDKVQYLANYDELTGHFNKTRLREALDQALYYCGRYKVEGALLVIGIDNINVVNQAFGYEVADAVIVAVGHRLDQCLRSSDTIGRLSGDCFGVLLNQCSEDELPAAAEKILEVARNTEVATPAGPIHVTVSIGAVIVPDSAKTATDALTKAEIALHNAKRSGRNNWSLYRYTEAQREVQRNNMVIAEQVKCALREDRLRLSFQAIVDCETHEPVVWECLLRMVQPDGEIVAAGMFMPVVEELGLIRQIDRRVLELAVAVMVEHPTAQLAINVSGLTSTDQTWLRHVVALLRAQPEVAKRLVVEITETASLEDVEECARFVSTLRGLGCRVALDDFGAGYTSFRHLKILAVDMVKIDGAFIRDLPENPANMIFIRSLLDLARNFGLETVAECVETLDQAEMLRKEGVGLLQGWAFGKPQFEPPWPSVHDAVDDADAVAKPVPKIRSVGG